VYILKPQPRMTDSLSQQSASPCKASSEKMDLKGNCRQRKIIPVSISTVICNSFVQVKLARSVDAAGSIPQTLKVVFENHLMFYGSGGSTWCLSMITRVGGVAVPQGVHVSVIDIWVGIPWRLRVCSFKIWGWGWAQSLLKGSCRRLTIALVDLV